MSSDRLFGLNYVCVRFHSGQWSRGYRLMSKLQVRGDSAYYLAPKHEWWEARQWAAHYLKLWRRGDITL